MNDFRGNRNEPPFRLFVTAKPCIVLTGILALLGFPWLTCAAEENWQQVRFQEVDTLFANPGQGWMSRRFPSSVAYLRFDWAKLEPAEGRYNWKYVDDAINACKPRGDAVALRVMTANAHTEGYYSSPKWLFDLGCKGFEYLVSGDDPTAGGSRIPRIEPDYTDPIYLAQQADFVAALGKRYDGNPNVEFLDIGSYGIWGEWHSPHPAPMAVRRRIVDMYLHAFHQTPLVGMVDDAEALTYTLAHGGGYRCDGIGSPSIQSRWTPDAHAESSFYPQSTLAAMNQAWEKAPVIFEWYGKYDYLKSKGWSFDAAVNFMLSNHVTLINDNLGPVPANARPQLQKLARLAGYRFVLREVGHEKAVPAGATLNVKMKWANVGVGKLYRPYALQLSLRNAAGQTVATAVTKADPREWLPGEREVAVQVPVPASLPNGAYILAVALVDPDNQHRPLNLAMDAPAQDGWYLVSQIRVEAPSMATLRNTNPLSAQTVRSEK